MNINRKRGLIILAALFVAAPALAVFGERDLGHTIHALRVELSRDYQKRLASEKNFSEQYRSQRREMISTMKKCNELSLMLYSQKQDYTFDLTYALESVTKEYNDYKSNRLPYDQILNRLDWDIDRYARLVESLRRIPPEIESVDIVPDSLAYHNDSLAVLNARIRTGSLPRRQITGRMLDSLGADRPFLLEGEESIDRDSCIFYAAELLKMSAANKERIIRDSTHYQRTFLRLKESYDYARDRYQALQNRIFVVGQTPYYKILKGFGRYWKRAALDIREKYRFGDDNREDDSDEHLSLWTGPALLVFVVLQFLVLCILTLIVAVVFKLLVRFIKPLRKAIPKEQHFSIILLIAIVINGLLTLRSNTDSSSFMDSADSLIGTYLWLLGAVVASLLIRLKPDKLKGSMRIYLPMMIMAVVVISLRIVFMPNAMMNVIFPPILLLFLIWQLVACLRAKAGISGIDRLMGWMSLTVILAALIVSFIGYIYFGLLIMIWWFFEMAVILTLITIAHLLDLFKEKFLTRHIEEYKKTLTFVSVAERDNLLFGATWFYDLVKDVLIPVLALMSLPFCIRQSLGVFDFTDLFGTIFKTPFVNLASADGSPILRLSFRSIVVAVALFFVFRYINYAVYSVFQNVRYAAYLKQHGRKTVRKDEINFSLGKSIIGTLVWFVYIITVIVMLRIPTSSLTIIAGGLSAGIGIALKDVLNNFIYGIQLMSGRVKVGDWIECDGVRGKVTSISYQSTQIETIDGAVISFLNATLFSNNFSNLTRNNAYEFVKIVVGVSYGTDVEHVRQVLVDAMQEMRTKDNYGREVVDPKRGVYVVFDGFGDSSVNIAVKQYILVAERIGYVDRAKEVIYDALNKAGITIPFPQCDIHVAQE
jgi:small-conductance mechanosensitive channel